MNPSDSAGSPYMARAWTASAPAESGNDATPEKAPNIRHKARIVADLLRFLKIFIACPPVFLLFDTNSTDLPEDRQWQVRLIRWTLAGFGV
ncbi:hypothetical protein [Paracoccus lichenicola]|uniref:hypothetical protein n=1 Tax=Paracoccus lichenicola TaxID=2665644 RepID=UPI002E20A3D3